MRAGCSDLGEAMKLPRFDYAAPASLAEAVALLAASGGTARPVAGGQTLVPILAFRMAAPGLLVDLRKVPGLDRIGIGPEGVLLGARVRWCDIETDPRLVLAHPLLVAAVAHVAHHQIRQRGTVGGSLAHADPAAELPGIAVTCDATLHLEGPGGGRRIPAAAFFRGPLETALAPDELVTAIAFPPWPPARCWGFEELARRQGDFALAGIALHYDLKDGRAAEVRIGVIGACTCPHRIPEAEAILEGQRVTPALAEAVGRAVAGAVSPPEDIHASAAYRRDLAGTLAERAVLAAMAREEVRA
jgi:carbon-monoxide dehydrogenase medium subunit